MKNLRFFTLVEVLAAMAIIVILSLIGYGTYSYATNAAKISGSEAFLKQLEAGLESFYIKNNYYPTSADGKFNAVKIALGYDKTVSEIDFGGQKLVRTTGGSAADRINNELFDSFAKAVDLEQLKQHASVTGELTDAWGGVIYYRAPGAFKTGSYDLVSAGPDGKFSGDNADTPVDVADVSKYRNLEGEHLCDDLFNF